MLGKLLKHEFKATARLLLPIYLLLVALTIMDRIVLSLHFKGALNLITGFVTFAYIVSLLGIVIVSFVIIILRFYKNLLTDEGYLMFTLPVKKSELVNSKLIVSFVWNIASMLAVILSLFCVFITPERMHMLRDAMSTFMNTMQNEFGTGLYTVLIIEWVILAIIVIFNGILLVYASIAVGQLLNSHRVLGSFGAYIAISTALQMIATVGSVILGMNLFEPLDVNDINIIPQFIFPVCIVFTAVTTIFFYWLTNFIFKKKLNLE